MAKVFFRYLFNQIQKDAEDGTRHEDDTAIKTVQGMLTFASVSLCLGA